MFSIVSRIHHISKDCHGIDKWSKMMSERVLCGPIDEAWGQDTKYVYTCPKCVSTKQGIDLKEAMLLISETANRHNSTRSARFKEAREAKRQEFEGLTHEGLRTVTLADLNELFFPLVDLLIKKIEQLESLQHHQEKIKELQDRLKKSKSLDEAKRLEEEISKLVEVEFAPLAFAGKADQSRYISASTFADEWIAVPNKQGGYNYFRSYYTCQSGGEGNECLTLILSKLWVRRHADPMATKQKYKCTWCNAKYKTWMGVVIEIMKNDVLYYFKAEIPTKDLEDVRAMHFERTMKPSSPEQLYNDLPSLKPHVGVLMTAIPGYEGSFKVNREMFLNLKTFNWDDIYNVVG